MEVKNIFLIFLTEVQPSTKQKLLELVCFYNSVDHIDERLMETKWFMKTTEEATYKTWK